MTRGCIQEYAEAVRGRYLRANKKEKGRILGEFVNVTGYHRKSAICLLHRGRRGDSSRRCGHPSANSGRYGAYIVEALKIAWEATDRLCSRRLQPFLPELIKACPEPAEAVKAAWQEDYDC